MIIFKKARSPDRTLNDLDSYLRSIGTEPIKLLAREVQSWSEFSYDELADLIADGRLDDYLDWQARYSALIAGTLAPLWSDAITAASKAATKGKVVLYDSNDYVRAWLETHGGELITQLSHESQKAVAMVIMLGQSQRMAPRDIAKQVRPLIGLTQNQATANLNYREKVYNQLRENGMSEAKARARADKAAIRYAGKQHRFRAETIVHTELAFAYNRGAHMGVSQGIAEGLMGRCAMKWSTAGTNRVCSRCLALKDTIVGYTDESGVTIPPLHPRCRCAIIYDEVEKPRAKPTNNATRDLERPSTNRGVFAHLEVPMQKRAVVQICKKYGVDISGLRIKIQRSEDWLNAKHKYAGMTDYYDVGRIDLTPHAFATEEELLRTVIHESCHVKQLKKYGREYAQENIIQMEQVAERYERFFLQVVKRRT